MSRGSSARIIVGANTRGYGKVFVDVLAEAKGSTGAGIADAVVAALHNLSESLVWPSDEDVEDAFVERRMYDQLTQERVRMLLGALDDRLQRDLYKGEQASFEYDKLQIEHIMPPSWEKHWPVGIEDPAERELAEQRRRSSLGRIGTSR